MMVSHMYLLCQTPCFCSKAWLTHFLDPEITTSVAGNHTFRSKLIIWSNRSPTVGHPGVTDMQFTYDKLLVAYFSNQGLEI